jgi:hypothetical protein
MSILNDIINKESELNEIVNQALLQSASQEVLTKEKIDAEVLLIKKEYQDKKDLIAKQTALQLSDLTKSYSLKKEKLLADFDTKINKEISKLVKLGIAKVLK